MKSWAIRNSSNHWGTYTKFIEISLRPAELSLQKCGFLFTVFLVHTAAILQFIMQIPV